MKKLFTLLLVVAFVLVAAVGCTDPAAPATPADPSAPATPANPAAPADPAAPAEPAATTGPDGRSYAAEQVYRTLYEQETSTLNYMYSSSEVDLFFGANCVEPLAASDNYGVLQPRGAESWTVSEDGLTYTVKIREGMKWYDYTGAEMGDVTAHDYVTSVMWCLDAKNDSSNTDSTFGYLVNAEEYNAYTAALVAGETPTQVVNPEDVGVKAVDDYTLVFTLAQPKVFFPTIWDFGSYYPMAQACIDAAGDNLGVDNTYMWYCGPYIMESFSPQQEQIYVKNPNYWDAEHVYIERVERKYNAEAATLMATMFLNGEVDSCSVTADLLTEWQADPTTAEMVSPSIKQTNYSYYMGFNFEPLFDEQYEPDNWRIAVNNENFRKSLFHGLDRMRALSVQFPTNAADLISNTITPKDFALNGTKDYTSYGNLATFTNGDSYDEAKAMEYKAKAIEEMTAAGAKFPVKILMQYNGDPIWAKECLVMKQQLEGLLGADYIEVVLNNFGSQNFLSGTRRVGNYALQRLNGGAGSIDPETWTFMTEANNTYTFAYDTTNKFEVSTKSPETTAIVDEYLVMLEAAKLEVLDVEKRYEAFANAEAFYLEHAMCIPLRATGGEFVATKLNPFEAPYTACGWTYLCWKGQHVYETAMSTDMFYAQLEAWNAVRAGN